MDNIAAYVLTNAAFQLREANLNMRHESLELEITEQYYYYINLSAWYN